MRIAVLALLLGAPLAHAEPPPQGRSIGFTVLAVEVDETVVGVAPGEARLLFLDELRELGWNAKGGESILFAEDEHADAELLIGGTAVEFRYRKVPSSQEFEVGIEWQIQDRRQRAIAYIGKSRGYASSDYTLTPEELRNRALRDAIGNLASRDAFETLVTAGAASASGTATPTWSGPLPVRPCADVGLTLPSDVNAVVGATVLLKRTDGGHGSGVVVSSDGFVLSAAHVVGEANDVDVAMETGVTLPAKAIRVDAQADVAILKVAGSGHPCVPLREARAVVGEEVWIVGSPASEELEFSVSKGIVSGLRERNGFGHLQVDAPVNPGNSGGPMVDSDGRVIGLVTSKLVGQDLEGLGFGLHAGAALERLDVEWADESAVDLSPLHGRTEFAALEHINDDLVEESRLGSIGEAPDPRVSLRSRRWARTRNTIIIASFVGGTIAYATIRSSTNRGR